MTAVFWLFTSITSFAGRILFRVPESILRQKLLPADGAQSFQHGFLGKVTGMDNDVNVG